MFICASLLHYESPHLDVVKQQESNLECPTLCYSLKLVVTSSNPVTVGMSLVEKELLIRDVHFVLISDLNFCPRLGGT